MKIRKITETALVGGNIQVSDMYNLLFEEKDTGIELDLAELMDLHELIKSNLGYEVFVPFTDSDNLVKLKKHVPTDYTDLYKIMEIAKLSPLSKYKVSEELEEESECPEYIEPPEEGPSTPVPYKIDLSKLPERVERDFSKYITMLKDGGKPKEIKEAIAADLKVSMDSAVAYYYKHVKKVVDGNEARRDKYKSKETSAIAELISLMPNYPSADQFKDACAMSDIGNGKYTVQTLKDLYLESHKNVRW